MLGQHPDLHAFPELQIFGSDTIEEMMTKNQSRFKRLASAGSIRSIAQIHDGHQTDESCARAWLWMQKRGHWSPVQFFNYLREAIPDQIAVEKTPVNTWKANRLATMIQAYPNAKFLHLSRSVNGNSKSLKEFIRDQDKLLGRQETQHLTGRALSREYPASVWHTCHRNILTIKPLIKPGNYLQIKGEDLLSNPNTLLNHFCKWMQINNDDQSINAMLRPHESPYAYVGPRIAVGGNDGKFMRQPILKLKPPSKHSTRRTFKEKPSSIHTDLDYEKFFGQYKNLSTEETAKIKCWASQLTTEIKSMQERLGY